jgi:KaiC/GvpD/RAD55 family RecA-like ATPase
MMPGMMPGQQPMGQPGMQQPQMQPGMQGQMMQPGMQPGMQQPQMQGGNPMMQMMQMMQMMMGQGGGMMQQGMDPAAMPFAGQAPADDDPGLDSSIIQPVTYGDDLIREQEGIPTGTVLDRLCLSSDGSSSLGGIPKGCTMAFVGPPGQGKTRSSLAALARAAHSGLKVGYVIAEEGFHSDTPTGRDDLCSRMVKIGMSATGLDLDDFKAQVLPNIYVLSSQYHKGTSWDDFISKYRYLVEQAQIQFVVVDSLNMLDPSKTRTADNLSALKTYNHDMGVTCVCVGQIKDTGAPVGGEALQHTADAVFLIESMGLGSKDMAALWGGAYREKISVIKAVKSVTTPTWPHPVRVDRDSDTGALKMHADQPTQYEPPK